MTEKKLTCADCKVRVCGNAAYSPETNYPGFCPTPGLQEGGQKEDLLAEAMALYGEDNNREIMIAAAEVESEGYCVWPRVEEIMRFAEKIGAHKIGIATCVGLLNEASIFADILRARGFEPVGIGCKAGSQLKVSVGIPESCTDVGPTMCNPILQAKKLEAEGTDLNVVSSSASSLSMEDCTTLFLSTSISSSISYQEDTDILSTGVSVTERWWYLLPL